MAWVYISIFLAAFFNACMDAFENSPNFNESIFRDWNKNFWCKDVSWKRAKLILGYRLDAWHICKSLMWACVIVGVIVAWCLPPLSSYMGYILHFIGLSGAPVLAFPLFYHVIFKIK